MRFKSSIIVVVAAFVLGLWGLSTKYHREIQSANKGDLDFTAPTIPLQKFKDTYPHLDDMALQKKIADTLHESPLMFFRSFVNTFYADLAETIEANDLVLCLGDAHPDNFGFLEFPQGTRFVFNDFDDSGLCPIRADAIRYFVALALWGADQDLIRDLIHEYALVLNGEKKSEQLSKHVFPDLNDKRRKLLKKFVNGASLITTGDLLPLPASRKNFLLTELKKNSIFSSTVILDIAQAPHDSGGSGGLDRYLVLLENSKGRDLIELKEISLPGTFYGKWPQPTWTAQERLTELKQEIWKESPSYYDAILIEKYFLVRSRTRDSLDLKDFKADDLKKYLQVQVGIIADHHKIYKKTEIAELEKWLQRNIPILKTRYLNTYQNLKRP